MSLNDCQRDSRENCDWSQCPLGTDADPDKICPWSLPLGDQPVGYVLTGAGLDALEDAEAAEMRELTVEQVLTAWLPEWDGTPEHLNRLMLAVLNRT